MAANTANARNRVLLRISEPSTGAIDAPEPLLLTNMIMEIFSGISPAMGVVITANTTTETPISTEIPFSEVTNRWAQKRSQLFRHQILNPLHYSPIRFFCQGDHRLLLQLSLIASWRSVRDISTFDSNIVVFSRFISNIASAKFVMNINAKIIPSM
jgi:hypothetical protein